MRIRVMDEEKDLYAILETLLSQWKLKNRRVPNGTHGEKMGMGWGLPL